MPLFHTQSLKPVLRRSVQPGHAAGSQWPMWLMATVSGSASPGHCAQETALWPFMTPCTLSPWSCLHFHTYSDSCGSQQPRSWPAPFGTDAMWAELGFGAAPCSCPHLLFLPSVSLGALEGEGRISQRSCPSCTEDKGGEMRGILPEANALPGFRATHLSASEKGQIPRTGQELAGNWRCRSGTKRGLPRLGAREPLWSFRGPGARFFHN